MKKLLLLAAATSAAVAAPAFAQSSVTLFGIVDTTFAVGKGSISDRTQLASNGANSTRLGFRGTEDLGNGLKAGFWLEMGFAPDSGAGQNTNTNNQTTGSVGGGGLTFNRKSTVSLSGSWGEVRLGRDYTPQYFILADYDAFNGNGVGTSQTFNSIITGVTAVRASNSVSYWLPPNIGGVYGQVMYYLGENPSNAANSDDGKGYGVRLGYATGPFNIVAATSRTEYLAGDVKQSNAGASYDFGMAKVMGHISRDKAGAVDGKGWAVGTIVPVGSGAIRFQVSQYQTDNGAGVEPKSRSIALGYLHNLSKRTAVYATYARVRNSGGAAFAFNGATTAANQSSTGFDLGLRHSF